MDEGSEMNLLQLSAGVSVVDIENALSHGDLEGIRISPSLPPHSVARLITKMRASAYGSVFVEFLVSQPIDDGGVWRAVLEDPVDTNVAMTALANPMLPQDEVARLLDHPSSQVQGHAVLAQLRHQLPRLGEAELNLLLDANGGDHGVSLGVRYLVARSSNTPRSILLRLADDDADFIAEDARRRLVK